jgi:glutamate racemase
MKNNNSPIGIFDSGLGGLTVLKELTDILPNESFIYFGDTAHLPYGTKSKETIVEYSNKICDFLIKQKVKLIVVACNTASALAIEVLEKYISMPIINVIDPCIHRAIQTTKKQSIGIIGTKATISSRAYEMKLTQFNKNLNIITQACPLFVPIIEEGLADHKITQDLCRLYLNKEKFSTIDVLILGCTHYPLLINTIKKNISKNIVVIDSANIVAIYVKNFLNKNILNTSTKNQKYTKYFLTDKSIQFNKLASIFLKEDSLDIEYIKL